MISAVTLGKPRRVTTPLGTISFHLLPAELFLGYEIARLPELEFPHDFDWRQLRGFAARVKFARRRAHIERRIDELERAS